MKQDNQLLTEAETKLSKLFPVLENIPEALRIKDQKHQNTILINGELQEWIGPVHHVWTRFLLYNTIKKKKGSIQ